MAITRKKKIDAYQRGKLMQCEKIATQASVERVHIYRYTHRHTDTEENNAVYLPPFDNPRQSSSVFERLRASSSVFEHLRTSLNFTLRPPFHRSAPNGSERFNNWFERLRGASKSFGEHRAASGSLDRKALSASRGFKRLREALREGLREVL